MSLLINFDRIQLLIPNECIYLICDLLTDIDKIYFLSINPQLNILKNNIMYHDYHFIDNIHQLSYFNNFTHICVSDTSIKLPINTTHLIFVDGFSDSIKNYVPHGVTHLDFGKSFNTSIKDCLPSTITHLTFSCGFNHLLFDNVTDTTLKNSRYVSYLPCSLTHLELGCCYWFELIIPKNIVRLKRGGSLIDLNDKSRVRIIGPDGLLQLINYNNLSKIVSKINKVCVWIYDLLYKVLIIKINTLYKHNHVVLLFLLNSNEK